MSNEGNHPPQKHHEPWVHISVGQPEPQRALHRDWAPSRQGRKKAAPRLRGRSSVPKKASPVSVASQTLPLEKRFIADGVVSTS